jgi:hypothetical protein
VRQLHGPAERNLKDAGADLDAPRRRGRDRHRDQGIGQDEAPADRISTRAVKAEITAARRGTSPSPSGVCRNRDIDRVSPGVACPENPLRAAPYRRAPAGSLVVPRA